MKSDKMTITFILLVSAVVLAAGVVIGQKPDAGNTLPKEKVILKGRIDFMPSLGGYYVKGEDPPTILFIENQNPRLLEEVFKSGKTVSIEGHLTVGADYLFIEKVDGRPYHGTPGVK